MQCLDYYLERPSMKHTDIRIHNVGFGEVFANYSVGEDSRSFWLMEFYIRGLARMKIENRLYEIPAGYGSIMAPGQHFTKTSEGSGYACWIGFSGEIWNDYLQAAGLLSAPVFRFRRGDRIVAAIENAYRDARDENISDATLISYVFQLIGYITEDRQIANRAPVILSYFQKAKTYIDQNIYSDISVRGLSDFLDISQAQMYRSFMNNVNMSPKQYIDQQKITKACDLLSDTDLSGRQISSLLGFQYYNVFYKSFARYIGMTPSEYRESKK